MAKGSDIWLVTWADDDILSTSYGDGRGFAPYTDIKLSLGIAKIKGDVPVIKDTNIHSNSRKRIGRVGKVRAKS